MRPKSMATHDSGISILVFVCVCVWLRIGRCVATSTIYHRWRRRRRHPSFRFFCLTMTALASSLSVSVSVSVHMSHLQIRILCEVNTEHTHTDIDTRLHTWQPEMRIRMNEYYMHSRSHRVDSYINHRCINITSSSGNSGSRKKRRKIIGVTSFATFNAQVHNVHTYCVSVKCGQTNWLAGWLGVHFACVYELLIICGYRRYEMRMVNRHSGAISASSLQKSFRGRQRVRKWVNHSREGREE